MKNLILGVVLAVLFLSGCSRSESSNSSDAAFTINDEAIPVSEFNIYLYETQQSFEQLGGTDIWETDFDGRTAESVAKDNTFNTVVMVKITAQKAAETGLSIDDETKEKIRDEAEEIYSGYSDSIKNEIGADEQMYYDVMYENALYNIVYEDTVKNYSVSDEDFENFFAANKDSLIQYYKTNVDSAESVSEDAVKDYSYEYYNDSMKQQYFSKEYDKWKSESIIKKNQEVWDKITLIQ